MGLTVAHLDIETRSTCDLKTAGLLVAGQKSAAALQKIIEVSKTRMKKLSDINDLAGFFFLDKLVYDKNFTRPEGNHRSTILIAELRKGICEQTYSWGTDDVCHDNETLEVTHWMPLPQEPE